MASKEIKKAAQKESPKKGRRLKRSVRKTLGAITLAAAIAVAAIPAEGLQAWTNNNNDSTSSNWGTLLENMTDIPTDERIPKVTDSDTIYTTGDGRFQFVYKSPTGNTNDRVAILVGYNKTMTLPGGKLEIPETVDAYMKYSTSQGTSGGYCAINRNEEFLYYQVVTKITTTSGNEEIVEEQISYQPCIFENIDTWGKYADTDELYYYPGNDMQREIMRPSTEAGSSDEERWLRNADVRYIGNEYAVANTDSKGDPDGTWKLGGTVNYTNRYNGIFAGATNIDELVVSDKLSGIGDYAFFECNNLDEITLANNLIIIGVGAFAYCGNMYAVNLDPHALIHYIGDYAFYGCAKLPAFTVPNSVRRLGDSVFEGCSAMTTCNLITYDDKGQPETVMLKQIGKSVFKNCSALTSVIFPETFGEEIPATVFEGCGSLKYIEIPNNDIRTITFTEGNSADTPGTVAWFKTQVPSTFYFKGKKDSLLHRTATTNEIAFSYFEGEPTNKNVYELTIREGGKQIVYRVDEDDNLIYFGTADNSTLPETVTLPENIGPQYINSIDAKAFQGNCHIVQITIPSSVQSIAESAFRGCHKLKYVIFTDPTNLKTIGDGAFKTQEGVNHDSQCTGSSQTLDITPQLYFVGPISSQSEPFRYAMDPDENINNLTQTENTYITYLSGWPTFLEVQYNAKTGKNELIKYPVLGKLADEYTKANYPFMTDEYQEILSSALDHFINNESLIGGERAVIDAVLEMVLPEGITGIKKDLFVEREREESTGYEKTITAESLVEVSDGAFSGHPSLTEITLKDATTSIGTHAFENCTKLNYVSLPGTVKTLGTRPFAGCSSLANVYFRESPYFTCESGIIYELNSEGKKDKIVELLEGSGTIVVSAIHTAGITAVYPEAFKGTKIISADFSNSTIKRVPTEAFADTRSLAMVTLPGTFDGGMIEDYAFRNSTIQILQIPGMFTNMTEVSFEDADHFDDHTLQIVCEEESMAEDFAIRNNLPHSYDLPAKTYRVRFFYYDDDRVAHQIGEDQYVQVGDSATVPDAPEKEGKDFDNYYPLDWMCITDHDVDTYAEYKDKSAEQFTVVFQDDDGRVLNRQTVTRGGAAVIPQSPTKEGHIFLGWVLSGGDGSYVTTLSNVQADMVLIARYRVAEPGEYDDGTGVGGSGSPGASGGPGGSGGPGASDGSGNGNGNGNGTSGTFYNLTVVNGSGSGSYLEGSQPVIIANDPASGQVFDHWTVSPADVKIASTVLSASIITMPASDVTVTAHYKAGSGSSTTGGGSTGSGNNSQRPNGVSESVTKGGTTVVIDKNGLSNTGVVSATVNGSSDNFTIKITETAEANEAALRALSAEYGDNLDNIKYFPMDISLYDSTGTNKITDTSGLSISITLPLPDSLITYAGNNMVASTAGNRLERLSARFSTIQGVSCITFTAEHFSPYVIYVNTRDLSSGLVSDDTPKTGDFIHPKWFLSIGLACLSFVLFMQKDTRKQKKVKVRVRA